jgi:hypothetical protein
MVARMAQLLVVQAWHPALLCYAFKHFTLHVQACQHGPTLPVLFELPSSCTASYGTLKQRCFGAASAAGLPLLCLVGVRHQPYLFSIVFDSDVIADRLYTVLRRKISRTYSAFPSEPN